MDVVLEVADLLIQIYGLDACEPAGPGGADDALDVAVVKLAEPAGAEHARGDPGQPAYLRGGDLFEPRREPPFALPPGGTRRRPLPAGPGVSRETTGRGRPRDLPKCPHVGPRRPARQRRAALGNRRVRAAAADHGRLVVRTGFAHGRNLVPRALTPLGVRCAALKYPAGLIVLPTHFVTGKGGNIYPADVENVMGKFRRLKLVLGARLMKALVGQMLAARGMAREKSYVIAATESAR